MYREDVIILWHPELQQMLGIIHMRRLEFKQHHFFSLTKTGTAMAVPAIPLLPALTLCRLCISFSHLCYTSDDYPVVVVQCQLQWSLRTVAAQARCPVFDSQWLSAFHFSLFSLNRCLSTLLLYYLCLQCGITSSTVTNCNRQKVLSTTSIHSYIIM